MRRFLLFATLLTTFTSVALADDPRYSVYFGNLHSLTSYSDSKPKPADAHAYARDKMKLDVFILTDHKESLNDDELAETVAVVDEGNVDGPFVALLGLRWTKNWRHLDIFSGKKTQLADRSQGVL
jgi:hypothetical protein